MPRRGDRRATGGIEEIDHDAAIEALALHVPWDGDEDSDEDEWDDIDVGGLYAAQLLASGGRPRRC